MDFSKHENIDEYLKEIMHGGADVVIECVDMDGKMTAVEYIETVLKMQAGSKSAIEIATQAVRKGSIVSIVGVYGGRYNNFPPGDFFARKITLKMGQCPVHSYIDKILDFIKRGLIDATDIITQRLPLEKCGYAYDIFDNKKDGCIKVILKL